MSAGTPRRAGQFFLGLAVWAYKGWLGDLFPPGTPARDFLRVYSRKLTTVEGNTTFYATPGAETVRRWAEETPETFQFCFKLPREISHEGPLAARIDATRAFVARLMPLGPRLGPFFLQLPPGYGPRQIADLEAWLKGWVEGPGAGGRGLATHADDDVSDPQRRDAGIPASRPQPPAPRLAVEVRHPDWFAPPGEDALMELLERAGAGRVLLDVRPLNAGPLPGAEEDLHRARDRKPDVPLRPLRSSDLALVRYISHPDISLNAPFLDEWTERIAGWLATGTDVYLFVHCPVEERSPAIARAFHRRLVARAGVPPLPLDMPEEGLRQTTLF
jgi:uncharacterized protein YecE (DUF72 family)